MRTFYLWRVEDETGISGTGKVAEGVQFSDGSVVMNWTTPISSVVMYESIENVLAIHGHGGKTKLMWGD